MTQDDAIALARLADALPGDDWQLTDDRHAFRHAPASQDHRLSVYLQPGEDGGWDGEAQLKDAETGKWLFSADNHGRSIGRACRATLDLLREKIAKTDTATPALLEAVVTISKLIEWTRP